MALTPLGEYQPVIQDGVVAYGANMDKFFCENENPGKKLFTTLTGIVYNDVILTRYGKQIGTSTYIKLTPDEIPSDLNQPVSLIKDYKGVCDAYSSTLPSFNSYDDVVDFFAIVDPTVDLPLRMDLDIIGDSIRWTDRNEWFFHCPNSLCDDPTVVTDPCAPPAPSPHCQSLHWNNLLFFKNASTTNTLVDGRNISASVTLPQTLSFNKQASAGVVVEIWTSDFVKMQSNFFTVTDYLNIPCTLTSHVNELVTYICTSSNMNGVKLSWSGGVWVVREITAFLRNDLNRVVGYFN
jgi:hypothetical protein